jgi:hypothetical protein
MVFKVWGALPGGDALQKQFSCILKTPCLKIHWVRDPFATNLSRLTTCEQEQLIDRPWDGPLKDEFHADKLP